MGLLVTRFLLNSSIRLKITSIFASSVKEKKRLARKIGGKTNSLDDMIAYVDENGMLSDTPPDLTRKRSPKAADIEVSIPKRDASEPGHKVKQGRLTFLNEIKGYGFINEWAGRCCRTDSWRSRCRDYWECGFGQGSFVGLRDYSNPHFAPLPACDKNVLESRKCN